MKKLFILILLMALILIPSLLQAKICFRGKVAPKCKSFLITEFSFVNESGRQLTWEFGIMVNRNKQYALGVTSFTAFDEYDNIRIGIKVRYRQWLSSSFSLDISPGLFLWDNTFRSKIPEFTGHIGLNYKDWIALIGQIDVLRHELSRKNVTFSLGIKFGSYPGTVLTGVSIIVAIIGLISVGAQG